MTWSYRIVHWDHRPQFNEDTYDLREIHYDEKGEVEYFTALASAPLGLTPEELRADLEMMLAALDKGVLEGAELPGEKGPK